LLSFENGIPSDDTFERVFGLLNPKYLEEILIELSKELATQSEYKSIALDGKTLRGSKGKNFNPPDAKQK
jgi:hypothetical protein